MDCLFCSIIAGDIQSNKVAETELSYAFRDISPAAPTHVLVIPKRHVPDVVALAEASAEELQDVFQLAGVVATQEQLTDGYRMVANTGPAAQQTVFHAHVHVLGGRDFTWPPG